MAMNPTVGIVKLHHVPRVLRSVRTTKVPNRGDEEHAVPSFHEKSLSWFAVPSLLTGLRPTAGEVGTCNELRRPVEPTYSPAALGHSQRDGTHSQTDAPQLFVEVVEVVVGGEHHERHLNGPTAEEIRALVAPVDRNIVDVKPLRRAAGSGCPARSAVQVAVLPENGLRDIAHGKLCHHVEHPLRELLPAPCAMFCVPCVLDVDRHALVSRFTVTRELGRMCHGPTHDLKAVVPFLRC